MSQQNGQPPNNIPPIQSLQTSMPAVFVTSSATMVATPVTAIGVSTIANLVSMASAIPGNRMVRSVSPPVMYSAAGIVTPPGLGSVAGYTGAGFSASVSGVQHPGANLEGSYGNFGAITQAQDSVAGASVGARVPHGGSGNQGVGQQQVAQSSIASIQAPTVNPPAPSWVTPPGPPRAVPVQEGNHPDFYYQGSSNGPQYYMPPVAPEIDVNAIVNQAVKKGIEEYQAVSRKRRDSYVPEKEGLKKMYYYNADLLQSIEAMKREFASGNPDSDRLEQQVESMEDSVKTRLTMIKIADHKSWKAAEIYESGGLHLGSGPEEDKRIQRALDQAQALEKAETQKKKDRAGRGRGSFRGSSQSFGQDAAQFSSLPYAGTLPGPGYTPTPGQGIQMPYAPFPGAPFAPRFGPAAFGRFPGQPFQAPYPGNPGSGPRVQCWTCWEYGHKSPECPHGGNKGGNTKKWTNDIDMEDGRVVSGGLLAKPFSCSPNVTA